MAVAEFGSITGYFYWGKSGQTRILAIGDVGDKTEDDRPREHCTRIFINITSAVRCYRFKIWSQNLSSLCMQGAAVAVIVW
jgi:hypothetical protein